MPIKFARRLAPTMPYITCIRADSSFYKRVISWRIFPYEMKKEVPELAPLDDEES